MNILRLTTSLDFGGVERMYELFATHYQGVHDYTFVALGSDGRTGTKLRDEGFKVYAFGFANASVYNPKVTFRLTLWLKKNRFDIIHTASAEANFHGTLAAKMAGVPVVVVEEIGIPNHSRLGRFVFRQVYRLATDFIWESTAINERLIELKEVNAHVGTVIHNPVAVPELSGKSSKEGSSKGWLIASIGRLTQVKNFELLIRLVSYLNQNDQEAHLILIGEGPYRANLESLVKDLSAEPFVDMPGFASEPTNVIANADVYIQPSFSEGFGISVVEAMMIGLPCIGSQIGGIRDIIDHGKNGWFMDPKTSVEELARLVYEVMNLPLIERKAVADKGMESAKRRFVPENYIQKLEALYERNYVEV